MLKRVTRRFSVCVNEGSFFYEPWLSDSTTSKSYRYNKIPPRIAKAFAKELRERGKMNPHEARLLCEIVIKEG